jgi:hypothetical protein
MKHLKEGVVCSGMQPVLLEGLLSLAILYHQYEQVLTITALQDGTHMPGSLHYRGYAADLRTHTVPDWQLPHLLDAVQHELGPAWDVVQEKDHFHIEYDPQHDGGKSLS